MIFINALLLGGLAAAAIPLIIHLLNRTRFKLVDWGAMHLLESAIKLNTRRLQWQALLLLLLRIAIPALLALCLARPVLTAWRTSAGGNQHSVVLVVDNSLSMQAPAVGRASANPEATQFSCFDSAIAQAQALASRFGPATEITVLSAGGGVIDQTSGATFDSARVARRLGDITTGAGPAAIEEALATGVARLAKAKQPRRHLILLSDFQRTQWDSVAPDSLTALRASALSGTTPIEVTFIPIESRGVENVSVQIDRPLGPSVVTAQQSLEVRVAVRNHGRQRVKDLPVVLSANGQALASKNVEVAGDSQIFLAFTCQLQSLGTHVLSVAIGNAARSDRTNTSTSRSDPSNPVSGDDVSRWSVEVIQPVRVGIVTMRPPNSKSIDDAAYLNLALAPFAVSLVGAAMSEESAGWAEAHAGADPIQCEIVGPQELTASWLAEHQAVALMNIPKLEDVVTDRLSEFVQAGGMLMVWAGDSQDVQWYNSTWGPDARVPLLAAQYGEVSRKQDRPSAVVKIQNQSFEHPALTFFNRSSNGRLDSVDFHTWRQLKIGAGSLTLLSLDNGDPLLVERVVGQGRVLQWAINAGQRWSNLPLREVFVPLVQQLVLYGATSSMPRLNMETGATLAVALDKDPPQPAKTSAATKEIELLTPAGLRFRLEPQLNNNPSTVQPTGQPTLQPTVQFAMTNFPGAYQLSGVRERPLAIAVNAPPGESILEPLDGAALKEWAGRLDAQVHASADAFWESELIKQTGREIWRWLLGGLVLFLFAELLLQQSLTRTPT